jgi:hypothetical protein
MAKLKILGNHKFVTQGIWLQRGSKKTLLTGKKAVEYYEKFNQDDISLYVFTAKKREDVTYNEFQFRRDTAKSGSIFDVVYNKDSNTFEVSLTGEFERDLNATELKMLFENGQTVDDIGFAIKGLMGGEIWNKGFISRIDSTPDSFNAGDDSLFPTIDFEFKP